MRTLAHHCDEQIQYCVLASIVNGSVYAAELGGEVSSIVKLAISRSCLRLHVLPSAGGPHSTVYIYLDLLKSPAHEVFGK